MKGISSPSNKIALILLSGSLLVLARRLQYYLEAFKVLSIGFGLIAFFILSFGLLFLAVKKNLYPKTGHIIFILLLLAFCFFIYIECSFVHPTYETDGIAFHHYAAELLLEGKNPYTHNMLNSLIKYRMSKDTVSFLQNGRIETKMTYPAGSFLSLIPFLFLGFNDIRLFYALCLIGITAYIYYYADKKISLFIPLALLSNTLFIDFTSFGLPDPLWALFVLLAWTQRKHFWRSSILFGLAVATKQVAWFILPFYLIGSLREDGFPKALRRLEVIGGTFLAINLPFIILSPYMWLRSILAPLLDPFFPGGVGIVILLRNQLIPPLPKFLFSLVTFSILVILLVWYYIRYQKVKPLGIILGTIPLWFTWRSGFNFFYLNSLLLLGVIMYQSCSKKKVSDFRVDEK